MSSLYLIHQKDGVELAVIESSSRARMVVKTDEHNPTTLIFDDLSGSDLVAIAGHLLRVAAYVSGDEEYFDLSDSVLANLPANQAEAPPPPPAPISHAMLEHAQLIWSLKEQLFVQKEFLAKVSASFRDKFENHLHDLDSPELRVKLEEELVEFSARWSKALHALSIHKLPKMASFDFKFTWNNAGHYDALDKSGITGQLAHGMWAAQLLREDAPIVIHGKVEMPDESLWAE